MGKPRHRSTINDNSSLLSGSGANPKSTRSIDGSSTFSLVYWLISVALLSVGVYFAYYEYLQRRISMPLPYPKVVEEGLQDELYWGSYRPGSYFGLKARHPRSPVFGLMWFTPDMYTGGQFPMRHWCEEGDHLDRYGWLQHDGRMFGVQEIVDKKITLQTSFVKRPEGPFGGDWSARIKVQPKRNPSGGVEASVLFYAALSDRALDTDVLQAEVASNTLQTIQGRTEALGRFQLSFQVMGGAVLNTFYLSTRIDGLQRLREYTTRGLRVRQSSRRQMFGLAGELFDGAGPSSRAPNLVVYQVVGASPFEVEVRYQCLEPGANLTPLSGVEYEQKLAQLRRNFDDRFEERFLLNQKGYSDSELRLAQAALSNMVGGIGYFHGSSLVQSPYNKAPVPYWPAPLFTAVPSRSFFPRGFLWDEGFHNLLISQWDAQLSRQIIAHWLDLVNVDGWIPREQILGSEALSRVPEEFVVQRSSNANPPTMILTLHAMVTTMKSQLTQEERRFLELAWPRLEAWYDWFNRTQSGKLPGTYRWRGRDSQTVAELNPKTLTSGLDDYPRASHPTDDERHLDLRCWMALASRVLADIGRLVGASTVDLYETTYTRLADNQQLDRLHWSEEAGGYMDYGLHTDQVRLVRATPTKPANHHQPMPMIRHVGAEPKLRHVDSYGYVSLFPFLLQLLEPSSPRLPAVLDAIEDPNIMWTKFGLRSLARSSPLYMRRNTEHDPPYWRGPIWINMNFLAVRALAHYSAVQGPYQQRMRSIYTRLRSNIVDNIVREYMRTGYIWEQYNDSSGWGQGCKPFTGWSALVVVIMAESY